MIPLSCPSLQGNELRYVEYCLKSEWISTSGQYVADFEQAVAGFVGKDSAVATVNGTAALHITLLLAGVEPGDEVIVPTLTFIAPVNAVRYVGAEPVFMDCDDFLNMDVIKLRRFCETACLWKEGALYNKVSGKRIRAIMPVHVFGAICDMQALMDVAKKYELAVIEDATEALGSVIAEGTFAGFHAGTIGDFGCYSFNGNKIISTGGGGMIVADNQDSLERARYLTTQAKDDAIRYIHHHVGYNYRLPALLAAVGVAQMEQLTGFIERKQKRYEQYREEVTTIPGLDMMRFPDYCKNNYWFYSLIVDMKKYGIGRDQLIETCSDAGVQARPVWTLSHNQKPYNHCQAYCIEKAVWYQQRILNIPCSAGLTDEQFEQVVSVLKSGGQKC